MQNILNVPDDDAAQQKLGSFFNFLYHEMLLNPW